MNACRAADWSPASPCASMVTGTRSWPTPAICLPTSTARNWRSMALCLWARCPISLFRRCASGSVKANPCCLSPTASLKPATLSASSSASIALEISAPNPLKPSRMPPRPSARKMTSPCSRSRSIQSRWHMPKLLPLFLVVAPALVGLASLPAQSVIAVPPNQCVWHAGDNPAWAMSALDESDWLPLTKCKAAPDSAPVWIRCHADLSSLNTLVHPAIQISFAAAYQLYLDGAQIGAFGDLRRGTYDLNTIRAFPVSPAQLQAPTSTLALRASRPALATNSGPINGLVNHVVEVRAGDASLLDAVRAQTVLARASHYLPSALCFGVVGVVAVMLIALFLYDPTRREFLLLSITCLCLTTLRLNEFATASCLPYPITVCLFIVFVGNVLLTPTQFPFFFALAGRRTPRVIWILIALVCLAYIPNIVEVFFPANQTASLAS